jgi:hypothetical protein
MVMEFSSRSTTKAVIVLPSDEALDTFPLFVYLTGEQQKHQVSVIPSAQQKKDLAQAEDEQGEASDQQE